MVFNFYRLRNYTAKLSIFFALICVFGFTFWFYQIGLEDEYIQTLSWVVSSKKIVIDPGHGGIFPGKVSANNIKEKEINLEIAKQLAEILSESGAMVVMTRNTDTDLVGTDVQGSLLQKQRIDLQNRVKLARDYNADIFISIHCNSIPSERWSGAQTFFEPGDVESEQLAKCIQNELIQQLKNTKRQAIQRKDTFLFNELDIPTVIVECGFLSNPKEARLLTEPEYQYRLAYAIYSGIVKYLADKH